MSIISVLFLAIAGYLVFTDFAHYWYFAAGALLPVVIIWFVSFRARRRAMAQYRQADEQRQSDSEHERLAHNAESLRQATRQQIANDAAAQQRAAQPAPTPAQPVDEDAAFEFPDAIQGYCLAYSYYDVGFIVPPMCESDAKAVPPCKKLSLSMDDDTKDVYIEYDGRSIGRMYPNKLRDMVFDFHAMDGASIIAVSAKWSDKPIFSLGFYLALSTLEARWQNNPTFKKCTLVGNGNDDMQSNIGISEIGNSVEFDEDFETGKTLASCIGGDIGYLPASMSDYMSEHSEIEARILSIEENENGKYSVKVMMIAKD